MTSFIVKGKEEVVESESELVNSPAAFHHLPNMLFDKTWHRLHIFSEMAITFVQLCVLVRRRNVMVFEAGSRLKSGPALFAGRVRVLCTRSRS